MIRITKSGNSSMHYLKSPHISHRTHAFKACLISSSALQGEGEHAVDLCDEPVAGRAPARHRGVGRELPARRPQPPLRGPRRRLHHVRPRREEERHARQARSGRGLRLGLLREQAIRPRLLQIRYVQSPSKVFSYRLRDPLSYLPLAAGSSSRNLVLAI